MESFKLTEENISEYFGRVFKFRDSDYWAMPLSYVEDEYLIKRISFMAAGCNVKIENDSGASVRVFIDSINSKYELMPEAEGLIIKLKYF
jgi:hypothetical protein